MEQIFPFLRRKTGDILELVPTHQCVIIQSH